MATAVVSSQLSPGGNAPPRKVQNSSEGIELKGVTGFYIPSEMLEVGS